MLIPGFFLLLWLDENTVVTRGVMDSEEGIYSVSLGGEINRLSEDTSDVCVRRQEIFQLALDGGRIRLHLGGLQFEHQAPPPSSRFDLAPCRFVSDVIAQDRRFASTYFLTTGYLAVFDSIAETQVGYFDSDTSTTPKALYDLGPLGSKLFRVKESLDGARVSVFPLAFSSQLRNKWSDSGSLRYAVLNGSEGLEWRTIVAGPWVDGVATYDFDASGEATVLRVSGYSGDVSNGINGLYSVTSASSSQIFSGRVYSFALSPDGSTVAFVTDGEIKGADGESIRAIKFESIK